VARHAVEKSLGRWRDGDETDPAASTSLRLVFVDHQRLPGQRLRAFAVRGEFELETCRCFKVRLELAEPDDSILATYYVFGQDPMWVYRAEDFDMIMHWEMNMPDAAQAKAAARDAKIDVRSKSEPEKPAKAPAATGKEPGAQG
jgi:hypothetical protein